ncbi:MAG: hypothetical protein ABL901_04090 [Hyphomicrobiaceae bacterium]
MLNTSNAAQDAAGLTAEERAAVRNLCQPYRDATPPNIAASLRAKKIARQGLGGLVLTDYGQQIAAYA